jgi:HAD hydrolase, family IA, variant 1
MIEKFEYVSFDLFDTLIFRTLQSPQDVFRVIPILYNERNTVEKVDEHKFYIDRIFAECKARKKAEKEEVSLDEIYSNLEYPDLLRDILKEIEIEFEIKNCIKNEAIIPILQECLKLRKKIIITTDMYLPRKCIVEILKKIDVTYEKLYISAEVGLTKLSGHLYDYILRDLNIDNTRIMHIGDNLITDISKAKSRGIEAMLRPAQGPAKFYSSNRVGLNPGLNHLISLANHCSDNTVERRIGEFTLAPFLFEFCHWINKKKKELKINKLYFLAREGYLIKKIYEMLFPEESENCIYLRLNKNIMRLPALYYDSSVETLIGLLPSKSIFTWEQIIQILVNGSDENILNISGCQNDIGIDIKDEVSVQDLLAHKYDDVINTILLTIREKCREQNELLFLYLEQNGLFDCTVGLVNNSINGNTQIKLEEICQRTNCKINMYGFQFVKSVSCERKLGNKVAAWLTVDSLPVSIMEEFKSECILFEHLMFENVGTANSLSIVDGKVLVELDDIGKEKENTELISNIQAKALQLFDLYKKYGYVPIGYDAIDLYLQFKKKPFPEDLKAISMLYDRDFDGEKKLVENVEFRYKYLLRSRYFPPNLLWINGYLIQKERKDKWLFDCLNICKFNRMNLGNWYSYTKYRLLDKLILKTSEKMQLKIKMLREKFK